ERVISHPQFSVRRLPERWREALASWVEGVAVADILAGRAVRDARRLEALLQDSVVLGPVWDAEALRARPTATGHHPAAELGDGPALALTYGVPSTQAALLCQIGFASRVGAVWISRQLGATFTDPDSLRAWLRTNGAFLSDAEFWESPDHYLLWQRITEAS